MQMRQKWARVATKGYRCFPFFRSLTAKYGLYRQRLSMKMYWLRTMHLRFLDAPATAEGSWRSVGSRQPQTGFRRLRPLRRPGSTLGAERYFTVFEWDKHSKAVLSGWELKGSLKTQSVFREPLLPKARSAAMQGAVC